MNMSLLSHGGATSLSIDQSQWIFLPHGCSINFTFLPWQKSHKFREQALIIRIDTRDVEAKKMSFDKMLFSCLLWHMYCKSYPLPPEGQIHNQYLPLGNELSDKLYGAENAARWLGSYLASVKEADFVEMVLVRKSNAIFLFLFSIIIPSVSSLLCGCWSQFDRYNPAHPWLSAISAVVDTLKWKAHFTQRWGIKRADTD